MRPENMSSIQLVNNQGMSSVPEVSRFVDRPETVMLTLTAYAFGSLPCLRSPTAWVARRKPTATCPQTTTLGTAAPAIFERCLKSHAVSLSGMYLDVVPKSPLA